MKSYDQLPLYLAGWDVALMPFAINEATRYISPTKTPEYLAAGLPVVSTPIRDVEREYGKQGLVRIEGTADGFIRAIEQELTTGKSPESRGPADAFLRTLSWDRTWSAMNQLIEEVTAQTLTSPSYQVPSATLGNSAPTAGFRSTTS
jgi:UDP-galactopyranose mutase